MMASEAMMNPVAEQRGNEADEGEVSDFVMNRHCYAIAMSTLVCVTLPVMEIDVCKH